jgi:hypothetical protein
MKIETKITGLSAGQRNALVGLVRFDTATNIGTFEWRADQNPPHDYATALNRARDQVLAAGGAVGEGRIVG